MPTSSWRLVGLVGLVAAATAPWGAVSVSADVPDNNPPRDSNKVIVFGASIGEVSLGQTAAAARAAWGTGEFCEVFDAEFGDGGGSRDGDTRRFDGGGNGYCTFSQRRRGGASFEFRAPAPQGDSNKPPSQVVYIGIRAAIVGYRTGPRGRVPKFVFAQPYASFRTAKGIGLGSTRESLLRAHPKVRLINANPPGINMAGFRFKVYGHKTSTTKTRILVAAGQVISIEVTD